MNEPRYAWVVVWAAFASLAVIFGIAYSFAAFFESFATEFTAQRADVSLVFGLSGLIYFILGVGGGILADRFGPRLVCSAGMLCIAGGLFATSFAHSMAMVYLSYGVGIGAGTLVVPLVAASAIAWLQWRGALRGLAAGVLVIGLGATLLLKRAPTAGGTAAGAMPGASLREALRSGGFWWLYLSVVASGPTMFIPFAHVSAAARDLGIDEARAVGLVGLIGIGSLVGRFTIGALADRMGRSFTLALVQASMGASYLLWHAAGGYAALALFALWFGLSYGGIVSLLPALCMDLFGARAVSSIIGALYSGAALGNLLGPTLAGAVFDRSGSYGPVIWGCMALSAVATLASARLIRPRQVSY